MADEVTEVIASQNDTDTTANEPEVSTEGMSLEEKLAHSEEQRKKLFERAKKAEGFTKQADGSWVKKPKPQEAPKPEAQTINTPNADADELKLIARGTRDEVIEQAKVIAKGKGISLIEAAKDPLIQSFEQDLIAKEKKEAAKLGASRGSGQANEEIVKPGMSRDEHQEAFQKALGK